MLYNNAVLATHCFYSYDSRSLLHPFFNITTLYFTHQCTHPTPFIPHHSLQFDATPERVERVSGNICTTIPLYRPGILAYHGMEWNTSRHFALHHFHPSLRNQTFCVSVWLHIYHYPTMSPLVQESICTTATRAPSSSIRSPLACQPFRFIFSLFGTLSIIIALAWAAYSC